MYLRNNRSSLTHSVLLTIDISSRVATTRRSRGLNFFSLIACSNRMRKLASVRPPICVAALPVSAVLTVALLRCQPEQNVLTASTTRILPVPRAPPRNRSS
ncbi:hypothetical protein PHMEG_00011001 [Phytophthora megakarya]|uniref:Uncharacterized protein n=1 Tax=Phytophthora megakarya TaxID=4795 RepID=A0A225WCA0_9STRA|nr:hypothetical protein PHMEG_00011001 [Phytophthora megakarya]